MSKRWSEKSFVRDALKIPFPRLSYNSSSNVITYRRWRWSRSAHEERLGKMQAITSSLVLLVALSPCVSHAAPQAKPPLRALLVVDVQGCFLPGGAIPVSGNSDSLIASINTLRDHGAFNQVCAAPAPLGHICVCIHGRYFRCESTVDVTSHLACIVPCT